MSTDKKKLSDYINWLFKNYEAARSDAATAAQRIVDHHKNESGRYEVVIQLVGKSVTFKMFPEDILSDDAMTELFSKKDVRMLTYLACENLKEPGHEVIGQKFVRSVNKFFFRLRHGKSGQELEKSAEEISTNPELLHSLHPKDAHTVGYVTANEQIKKENLKQDSPTESKADTAHT